MTITQKQKRGLILLAALLAAGAACFAALIPQSSAKVEDGAENRPPSYRYATVRTSEVSLTTELPGRVSALMVSEVRPQVSGIITARLFTEGADVEAGQVLYQIDPSLFEAAHNNAKAALSKAQANEKSARLLAERYGRIVKGDAVSRQEYDDAVAAYQQAKADVEAARQALETARINLSYTQIKAPVSGRIGHSMITPGALVTQHQPEPLATIQQLDRVYVDVTQSNTEVLRLRRAMANGTLHGGSHDTLAARLRLEDGSMYTRLVRTPDAEPEEIEGRLLFSDVTIEKSTGVVTIRAIFDNPDKILLPGMYVRAVVEEARSGDAILVPQRLVMRDNRNRPHVFVLTRETPAGRAETETGPLSEDQFYVARRMVSIDRHYDNKWLLSSGLAPGDKILAEGLQKVRPGMIITGLEEAALEGAAPAESASEQPAGPENSLQDVAPSDARSR